MFNRKKQPPIRSLISQGTRVEGRLAFCDGLRVDGEVQGDVRAEEGRPSILVISETAVVHGHVQAQHVIVNGHVSGPVHAGELLELQPKARIEGDVHYKALEMHQGAMISGQLCPAGGLGPKPLLKLAANNP